MRFYFTFGSDERFPYQNTYIIIDAPNRTKAHKAFREKFPDRTENIYNYSCCYEEKEWEEHGSTYYPHEPAETIIVEATFKDDVEMVTDLWKTYDGIRRVANRDTGNHLDETLTKYHNKYVLGLNYVATKWNVPMECITCWFEEGL